MKRTVRYLFLAVAILTICALAFAQSITGKFVGTVTDATGAVIPKANIKITNTQTNQASEATSGDAGEYTSAPLPPGIYSIEVSAPGFRKYSNKSVVLQVNAVLRVDSKLEPGQVTDTVEVTGGVPLVQTETSSIGQVITQRNIINLPLNGRNFTQLATLTPGVTRGIPGSNADGSNGNAETVRQNDTGSAAISANGLREQNNNFQLDGIDNNESVVNTIVFFPPIEALQEFRVITNAASAEFGRGGGAIINAVTKSGTNQWHGSAFEFYRSSALDAKPGRNNASQKKPSFLRNQFGGTLGGAIVKNRTWFFADYQGLRQALPFNVGNSVTVPTAKMRTGDFSELLNGTFNGTGHAIQIYSPITGLPYAGNIITDPLNAVGKAYLNVFPLPTRTDRYQQNYLTNRHKIQNFDDGDVRLDHKFSENDLFFARFSMAQDPQTDPGNIPGYHAGFGSGTNRTIARSWMGNYVHTFSPTLINELRFGWFRDRIDFQGVGEAADQNTPLGIPWPAGTDPAERVGVSLIGGGNGSWIEYLGTGGPFRLNEKTNQFTDSMSWSAGKHSIKFGANIIRRAVYSFQANLGKGFYFFPDYGNPGTSVPAAGRTGFEVSDMLVGYTAATESARVTPTTVLSWESGYFIQDDWRVNRRLTLNLGMRYEIFTPPYEKNDHMANYDPVNNVLIVPTSGGPRGLVDTDFTDFGPRAGFAYDLKGDGKNVIRASYGLFYALDRGGLANSLTQNPPFNVQQFYGDFSANAVTPAQIASGAYIHLSDQIPAVPAAGLTSPSGQKVIFRPRNSQNTRVHQFNVTYERGITDNLSLSAAYVGTRADRVLAVRNTGFGTGAFANNVTNVANIGESNYNSLQITANQRAPQSGIFKGLSFLSAYTYSRARNNSPGAFPGPNGNNVQTPVDPGGLADGLADYDVPHRFTWAGTYEFPFLRGANGFMYNAFGGWSMNSIVTLQKGTPFTVFNGDNTGFRAHRVSDPFSNVASGNWYNPAAFVNSATASDQMERNSLRGPGIASVDFSLFKTFKVTERVNFEFRTEMFNAFNRPQINFGSQTIGNGQLGQITGTRLGAERQIQFGGRIFF